MKKNQRDSMLILGAGNAQIDLILSCRNRGIETFGCSYSDTDCGIPLLDHFAQINIVDKEAILSYLRENEIGQIYSIGSDLAVPTVAYVAEHSDIPCFVPYEAAMLCCNKDSMRELLEGSIYHLPYITCQSLAKLDPDSLEFPLMIKPVDSQGQRGVSVVHNYEELSDKLEASLSYSRKGKVILEKYLDGDEISVNAYFKDGEMIFFLMSDRISYDEYPGGIIKRHNLPSIFQGKEVEGKVRSLVGYLAEKLGINNGPMYFQIMIYEDFPYLLECSPRLDGCHMWRLLEYYCGLNMINLLLGHMYGQEDEFRKEFAMIHKPEQAMSLEFFCQPPGTAFDESLHAKPFDQELYRQFYYKDGDTVKPINRYMEKCGYHIYVREE